MVSVAETDGGANRTATAEAFGGGDADCKGSRLLETAATANDHDVDGRRGRGRSGSSSSGGRRKGCSQQRPRNGSPAAGDRRRNSRQSDGAAS